MPNSRDTQLDILNIPWRIAGISSLVFASSLIVWASVTQVPIRVSGQGIYYSIGETSSFITSDYGKVYLLFNKSHNRYPADQMNSLLRSINRALKSNAPIELVVETAENMLSMLSEIESNEESAKSIHNIDQQLPIKIPPYQLIAYAESSTKKAALIDAIGNKNAIASQLRIQMLKNESLKTTLNDQLSSRSSFQKDLDELANAKIVSKLASLENREQIDNIKAQITALDAQLQVITTNLVKAESQVNTRFYDFVVSTLLYSNQDAFIQQVSIPKSGHMMPGQLVISYSKMKADKPNVIPVFFNAKDVATLNKHNRGIVSLPGYPRSIYGGIKASVIKRENLSVVPKQAETFLGLSGFSEFIDYNFISPTMVIVKLEHDNRGNYLWTNASPGNQPPKLRIGDKLDMEVVTGTIRPIEMIIPSLRNALGITPKAPRVAEPKADQR